MDSEVRDVLRQVIDPEVGLDIVDVGLIEQIEAGDASIRVGLILTTPACPQGDYLVEESRNALVRAFPAHAVEVTVLDTPLWTPDRLSPAARRMLGWED